MLKVKLIRLTKAIAEAYIEGYKAGYKDREEEIPMGLRDNKNEIC